MPINARTIAEACTACWNSRWQPHLPLNRDNCSGFIKSVTARLGIPFEPEARADDIITAMTASPRWKLLTTAAGVPASVKAAEKAQAGSLVIAGLKSSQHNPARSQGHVVVVVPGTLYRGVFPLCWGGSTGSAQSRGNKSTGEVWNTRDRVNLSYFYYE